MSHEVFFSVVIPNYKRVEELLRAVRSALNEKEMVKEVIVVDDCSENICEIENALKLFGSDKVFLIKNSKKTNAAATRNQGARKASAPWVSFLDSDDVFVPGKLARLRESIVHKSGEMFVLYNKAEVKFDGRTEKIIPSRDLKETEHVSDYLFTDFEVLQTSTLTIPRSFFDGCGFNESYHRHQDFDICLSLYERKYRFVLVDFVGTVIFWGGGERPTDKGESSSYSYQWAVDNKERMTKKAYSNFVFYFAIMKSARAGEKSLSLKWLEEFSGIKEVRMTRILQYFFILLIPRFLLGKAYIIYKKAVLCLGKFRHKS